MIISLIISQLSNIIWLLPIFRQRHSKFFPFFYALAVLSPFRIALYYYGGISVYDTQIPASFLILISALFGNDKRILAASVITSVFIYFACTALQSDLVLVIMILIHSSLVIYFLYELLKLVKLRNTFSFFFLLLVIYELSVVLKTVTWLTNIQTGEIYFYSTTAFQLLFGLYFSVFSLNSHIIQISDKQ